MEAITRLIRLYDYDDWATDRVLQTLQAMSHPDPSSVAAFAHILGAKRSWLDRILGVEPDDTAAWPELSLTESESQQAVLSTEWRAVLSGLKAEQLTAAVTYEGGGGRTFQTPLGEILTHVANHATYHRGEIMAAAGQAGVRVPSTDYVIWWNKTQKG